MDPNSVRVAFGIGAAALGVTSLGCYAVGFSEQNTAAFLKSVPEFDPVKSKVGDNAYFRGPVDSSEAWNMYTNGQPVAVVAEKVEQVSYDNQNRTGRHFSRIAPNIFLTGGLSAADGKPTRVLRLGYDTAPGADSRLDFKILPLLNQEQSGFWGALQRFFGDESSSKFLPVGQTVTAFGVVRSREPSAHERELQALKDEISRLKREPLKPMVAPWELGFRPARYQDNRLPAVANELVVEFGTPETVVKSHETRARAWKVVSALTGMGAGFCAVAAMQRRH